MKIDVKAEVHMAATPLLQHEDQPCLLIFTEHGLNYCAAVWVNGRWVWLDNQMAAVPSPDQIVGYFVLTEFEHALEAATAATAELMRWKKTLPPGMQS